MLYNWLGIGSLDVSYARGFQGSNVKEYGDSRDGVNDGKPFRVGLIFHLSSTGFCKNLKGGIHPVVF